MLQKDETVKRYHPCRMGMQGHSWVRSPAEDSTIIKAIIFIALCSLLRVNPNQTLTLAQTRITSTKVMTPAVQTTKILRVFHEVRRSPIHLEGGLDIMGGPRNLTSMHPIIVVPPIVG